MQYARFDFDLFSSFFFFFFFLEIYFIHSSQFAVLAIQI